MGEELTELFEHFRRDLVADIEQALETSIGAAIKDLREEMDRRFADLEAEVDA